jgi:peptide/nickel transport system substrate-binding protein
VDWLSRRSLPALLLVLALVTGASGCTTSGAGNGHTPPASRVVFAKGGTAVVAVPSLPSNFNPSAPDGANRITAEVMAQVWPQTFVTDNRLETTAEAGFVEDAEVESISPFTVVYTLNPKAVWSDGVPIGVADFIYNWHEQLQWAPRLPDSGLLAGYQAISSITSPNNSSVIDVTFSHVFTEWESLFSNLVPAHIAERYGWVDAFKGFDPAKVLSGGPFEISSFVPGVRLVLSRNPQYWFTRARLAHIVLEVQPSSATVARLESGGVNVAQVPESPEVGGLVAKAAGSGTSLTTLTSELPTLWELCFNTTAPLVDADAFRLGVAESLYAGEVTDDSVGLVYASAAPDESRLALGEAPPVAGSSGGGSAAGSGTPGTGDDVYDPVAALSSFRSAGYLPGAGGALRAGGTGAAVTLSLLVPTKDLAVAQAASVVQAELNAMGIRVVLHSTSLNTMLGTTLPLGEYQMALAPFLLTPYAGTQIPIYSGSVLPTLPSPVPGDRSATPIVEGEDDAAGVPGVEPGAVEAGVVTRDISGLEDAAVTTDLTDALTNLNPADDLTLINDADKKLWLDVPTIPLFQQPVELIHSSDLRGVSESPTWTGVFWDAQVWEIQLSPVVSSSESEARG